MRAIAERQRFGGDETADDLAVDDGLEEQVAYGPERLAGE